MRIERETLTSTANNDSRAAANCIIMLGIIPYFPGKNACPANLPFQVYTLPQKLPKMVFAGTTTLVFAVVNLAKVIPYSSIYPYTVETFKISAMLLPVAAIGTVAGKKLIERLSEKIFFLTVQIALFLISIKLVLTSL